MGTYSQTSDEHRAERAKTLGNKLLDLPDKNGVIKAQTATALPC